MTNRAAVFRKRNPLTIQAQVIWALIIREIMTRYGRHNIGFLWLFVEPMLFTLGITTLWTIAGFHHGSNLPITAFALTGYSTVLLWRNMPTRCVGAIAPNSSLMYHRNVRVLDIFLSRIALEAIGATMSFVTLGLLFNFLGLMDMPENPLLVVQGWLLTAWFGGSLAMLLYPLLPGLLEPALHRVAHFLLGNRNVPDLGERRAAHAERPFAGAEIVDVGRREPNQDQDEEQCDDGGAELRLLQSAERGEHEIPKGRKAGGRPL